MEFSAFRPETEWSELLLTWGRIRPGGRHGLQTRCGAASPRSQVCSIHTRPRHIAASPAFPSFADLSEYAISPMQWACGAGIVSGTSESTLTPQGEAARAQVAAMLQRFLETAAQ